MSHSEQIFRKLVHFMPVGKPLKLAEIDRKEVGKLLKRRKRDGKSFKIKETQGGYLIWRTR
jgi:hypothetical protein